MRRRGAAVQLLVRRRPMIETRKAEKMIWIPMMKSVEPRIAKRSSPRLPKPRSAQTIADVDHRGEADDEHRDAREQDVLELEAQAEAVEHR